MMRGYEVQVVKRPIFRVLEHCVLHASDSSISWEGETIMQQFTDNIMRLINDLIS
jgi:hypothetical protein